jgi:hypothetical protein
VEPSDGEVAVGFGGERFAGEAGEDGGRGECAAGMVPCGVEKSGPPVREFECGSGGRIRRICATSFYLWKE